MNETILEYLLSRKGQIVTLRCKRNLKTLKSAGSIAAEKESIFQARVGVQYDNMKAVQDKRESGELPPENQGLRGMEWEQFPYVLKSVKTGKLYVRFSRVNSNVPRRVVYRLNGELSTAEQLKAVCLASEFAARPPADCFNMPLESIIEVNPVSQGVIDGLARVEVEEVYQD